MLFKDISILDENFNCKERQWVGVLDGVIDYIGDEEPERIAKYGEVYEGRNRLLMRLIYRSIK